MAAPVDFSGEWKLETTSDNFEKLLEEMKIGFLMRKAIVKLKPEHVISQDGDNFTIVIKTAMRNREMTFKVGEEFEQKNDLENKMNRILVTWEGDSLVTTVLNDDNSPVFKRFLTPDGKMKVTQKKGDIEVFRIFVKAA